MVLINVEQNKIWSSLVMIHFTKCWFRLYPEELSSSNRITNQLMYVNPGGGEEGGVKTRKKILMWNGLVSWGGVHTGQEEFIKQKCPINRKLSDFIRLFYFLNVKQQIKATTGCCCYSPTCLGLPDSFRPISPTKTQTDTVANFFNFPCQLELQTKVREDFTITDA